MNDKQFKFIDLKSFKADDTGSGSFEGYGASYGVIDEGGDICIAGCASDSLATLNESGFAAHSHDWSFEGLIGFFTECREDEKGLYIVSQYHSTEDAQTVRTKVSERLAAKKTVGLSIGYRALVSKWISPDQYAEELPKYLRRANVEQQLEKAKKFTYGIRIIEKMEVYEVSLVTVPMNKSAMVASAKSLEGFNLKNALASGTFTENSDLMVSVCEEFALAMREFISHAQSKSEIRAKEGRTISKATLAKLKTCRDKMKEMADTHLPDSCTMIEELIAMAEPEKQEQVEIVNDIDALNLIASIQIFNDGLHVTN